MQNSSFLQILNIGLTSGVLFVLIGAAIAYGKLVQKVDGHEQQIKYIWSEMGKIREHQERS